MRNRFSWQWLGIAAIMMAAFVSCSGDGDDGTGPSGSIQVRCRQPP